MNPKLLQVYLDYRDDFEMFLEIERVGRGAAQPINQALSTALDFLHLWCTAYLEDMEG